VTDVECFFFRDREDEYHGVQFEFQSQTCLIKIEIVRLRSRPEI